MTTEEKLEKIKHINIMISNLKSAPNIKNKKTIQKLQQEIDILLSI